jgi:hypothetical protein
MLPTIELLEDVTSFTGVIKQRLRHVRAMTGRRLGFSGRGGAAEMASDGNPLPATFVVSFRQ